MMKARYRPTRSFLRGCIAGSLATFLFYTLLRFAEHDAIMKNGLSNCIQTVTINGGKQMKVGIENQLVGSSEGNDDHSGYAISDTLSSILHLAGSWWPFNGEYLYKSSSLIKTKKPLLVIVTTSQRKLHNTIETAAATLHHPLVDYQVLIGGKLKPSLADFVHSTSNVYHVPGCKEFKSPLSAETMACLLAEIHNRYISRYQWFVFAPSNTYVAGGDLRTMLAQFDPGEAVYMGCPSNQAKRGEAFCEEGPGVVLSNGAVKAIQPHLENCMGGSRHRGDYGLGQCFTKNLQIQCTTSAEAAKLFVNDVDGLSQRPDKLWDGHTYSDLLTLHPIRSSTHLLSIDLYCKHREATRLHRNARFLEKRANLVCQHLPHSSRPPLSEMDARLCKLNGEKIYNYTTIDILTMNVTTTDIASRFLPSDRFEVSAWKNFDGLYAYSSGSEVPITKVGGEFAEELRYVVKKAEVSVQEHDSEELKLHALTNGYVRYSGNQGREFILDLKLTNRQGKLIDKRVHLFRPHLPNVVAIGDPVPDIPVNFIVPLSHVSERFEEFLKMYEQLCLIDNENCNLILSIYGDKEYKKVQSSVQRYASQYPNFKHRLLRGSGTFTRARAMDLGLSVLKAAELAFMCDVDMTIKKGFVDRCRRNTVRHSRVYYPTFFKYYDMDYVYKFKPRPQIFPIKREHGHWASYSYGMVCIYKSDYSAIGGFDTGIEGWGEEDVDLFQKVLHHQLDVMRTPDAGLFHRYHDKVCSTNLTPTQFKHCISSREEDIADRMQLAEYVFYLEDQLNVKNRKLWSFRSK